MRNQRYLHPQTGSPLSRCRLIKRAIFCLLALFTLSFFSAAAAELTGPEQEMAVEQMLSVIRRYGLTDETTLQAMRKVPRHLFVPENSRKYGYQDTPLNIGYGQTISQPYIVAEMTSRLGLSPASRVLEIGTGSGYQAAVLAELTPHVYSVEIIEPLLKQAERTLRDNGYGQIQLRHADGYYGWPEAAPFDAIIVTCATGQIPPPLLEQLAPGGRMIIPVGKRFGTQYLILVTKQMDGTVTSRTLMEVRFVPLVRQ